MLLIGSRAICYHVPEFREPRDWDLVATDEEIDALAKKLPEQKWVPYENQKDKESVIPEHVNHKRRFMYGKNIVEIARTASVPYWKDMYDTFKEVAVMEDPVLGNLRVAPLDYLLLTKQCGLVYPIIHWHKNLQDVYFLKDFVKTVSVEVAKVWPACMADSARMFTATHQKRNHPLACCHPDVRQSTNPEQHGILHERFARSASPSRDIPGAWDRFPSLEKNGRKEAMIRHLAEEAQVVAIEKQLLFPNATDALRGVADPFVQGATMWLRWTLRELAIGPLPIEWRYFVVNHYREIRDAIPERWTDAVLDLQPTGLITES